MREEPGMILFIVFFCAMLAAILIGAYVNADAMVEWLGW